MKEITRIHIAKVAYNIEIDAKKDLESYIGALELYAGDQEILDDIELRITELLAERGVSGDGVIVSADVTAVRAQLGEPSDFASDEVKETATHLELESVPRKIYRDESDAVVGGVLAGLGKYIGVDPLWVRLAFIVLLFVSFGTALLVYAILWVIIPPARTAAERLRMNGELVTLGSIRSLGTNDEPIVNQSALAVRHTLRIGAGLALIAVAIGALVMVVGTAVHVFFGIPNGSGSGVFSFTSTEMSWVITTFSLFALAGLLLSVLASILANAVFRQIWSKRIGTAVVAIIVAGLLAFASGIGATIAGRIAIEKLAQADSRIITADLDKRFVGVRSLKVLNDDSGIGVGNTDISIHYVVSDKQSYELQAPKGVEAEITVADDGVSATLTVAKIEDEIWQRGYYQGSSILTVYGPALDRVETAINSPSFRYSNSQKQEKLNAELKGLYFTLEGTYDAVDLAVDEGARATADEAVVRELKVSISRGEVQAGVVRSLVAEVADACPAAMIPGEPNALIQVQAVSGGKITYNGLEQSAKSIENSCGEIVIGNEGKE